MPRACEWEHRLRSRTAFGRACSTVATREKWLETARREGKGIPSETLQAQIREGFLKFYDPLNPKYPLIAQAVSIHWHLDAAGRNGCFVLHLPDGKYAVVSKNCPRANPERDIIKACRGAVHFEQILAIKKREDTEVDHTNEGGFQRIYKDWRKTLSMTTSELYAHVVENDPLLRETCRRGFMTLREPWLAHWKEFHATHARLEELTPAEHLARTQQRAKRK